MRRSVRRWSRCRGTLHSLESGMRGMRRATSSLIIVSWLVNVTTCPAETMSCTQTRAVR